MAKQPKAADKAYFLIKDKILSGVYKPGERITEKELTETTGVSRTPVREALNRLQSESLLSSEPHHGVVVCEMSLEDALTTFEIRELLESYCARAAAENITPEIIANLEEVIKEQEKLTNRARPDRNQLGRLNAKFHAYIYSASRKRRLITILSGLIQPMSMRWSFQHYSKDDLQRSLDQHKELLKHLKAGDGDSAEMLMKLHIKAGTQHFRLSNTPE